MSTGSGGGVRLPPESPAEAGARLATEYLRLLANGRADDGEALLSGVGDARNLVFAGAALTTAARRTGRTLPTAMRAQASTRQVQLGRLRDASRGDVDNLRAWLREAAQEVLTVTRLAEAAHHRLGEQPAPAGSADRAPGPGHGERQR